MGTGIQAETIALKPISPPTNPVFRAAMGLFLSFTTYIGLLLTLFVLVVR